MNVLVISAHPDDEILGVGGCAAKHAANGDCVRLAILCEGISMRYEPQRAAEVAAQSRTAARILGAEDVILGDFPDQGVDTVPFNGIVTRITTLIQETQAEIIYSHFSGDLNRDHRILAEALLVAARPYASPGVREILMYETPSSTEWGVPQFTPAFVPNVFVDISAVLDRKIEAFCQYTAELRDGTHPRNPERLRERARYWGSVSNCEAAEALMLVRSIR